MASQPRSALSHADSARATAQQREQHNPITGEAVAARSPVRRGSARDLLGEASNPNVNPVTGQPLQAAASPPRAFGRVSMTAKFVDGSAEQSGRSVRHRGLARARRR
jgi:hypothetical protein